MDVRMQKTAEELLAVLETPIARTPSVTVLRRDAAVELISIALVVVAEESLKIAAEMN